MSEEKNRKNKLNEVLKGLHSKQNDEIIKSLKSLKVYGDATTAPKIFNLLLEHKDNDVEVETLNLLSSLKDTSMPDVIMEQLKLEKYQPIRSKVLSTIWQSGLNYAPHIGQLVEIAVEGTFMEKVECITIIENLEGPFEEEQILESMLLLREYFDKNKQDERSNQIMKEILLIMKDFQNQV